jgi:cytosine permease
LGVRTRRVLLGPVEYRYVTLFRLWKKGSILSSLIFAFVIIGFLALEKALLYRGFIFYFGLKDTIGVRIMSVAWILLMAYGFAMIARVSSIALVRFLAVLGYCCRRSFLAATVSSTDRAFCASLPACLSYRIGV